MTANPASHGGEQDRAPGGISTDARARLEAEAKELVARYPKSRSALLPLLHLVQAEEGFVSTDGIAFCAETLGLTKAEVTAVATFYTMYKRRPVGEYHVGVCTNPLCAVMGGDEIYGALKEHLGVSANEPTADGKVSVEHVECNAACDFAPVVMVNWEFFDNQTPQTATTLVDELREGGEVTPSRGPQRLCTFKEASRILAGFPDERAGEGPQAGEASLAGLRLARERGWTAPAASPTEGADTHEESR
jgi:NADH-quinone oxidoreductase subunit E